MAKVIDEKLTRGVDWNNYSGKRVQEFITEELGSKVGAFFKPEGSPVVLCFATKEDRDKYKETLDESLILDSFETESKYEIRLDGFAPSKSVIDGTTGNTLDFGFKIIESNLGDDEQYIAADAKAQIEFSFTGAGTTQKFTTEVFMNSGDWTRVSQPIDNYLKSGKNDITIKITGLTTLASRTVGMSYNLFDLSFVPSFDYSTEKSGKSIEIPYIIECSETKYIEFFIDGIRETNIDGKHSDVKTVVSVREDDKAILNIDGLSEGVHSLIVRAYVNSTDGTKFYTPAYYYTFAVAGDAAPSFLMSMVLDNLQALPIGEDKTLLTISTEQFSQISFNWAMYDYYERKLNVVFEYEGNVISTQNVDKNGDVKIFSFRPMNYGNGKELKIYSIGEGNQKLFETTILFNVSEASSGIKETTSGLLLKLQAVGRRNSDTDRNKWECVGIDSNTYGATFNNFTWNSQQGWDADTESLVISNGATVDFNIQPMVNDWAKDGGTIELDLETFDIENDDAVICLCKNDTEGKNYASFKITSTSAEFSTAEGKSISTRYKDNERLKIAFIGNKIGNHEDGNLIYIVVNGVLERAALYDNTDSIYSSAFLSIGDPNGGCKVRLRSIRVYNKALSVDEAFNNYVVDSDDVQAIYEKNNVLKAGTTEIGFDEVANKLPVMIFTGDMNELTSRGQDKGWRYFDVEYINRQEPERNFVSFNCRLKLQGTSSLGYPRKNFKLSTKDKLATKENFAASDYEFDTDSVAGNRRLKNKKTGKLLEFGDLKGSCYTFGYDKDVPEGYSILKKGKYRFRADAHKADKWTLKADFMESSCSHNVGGGRSWNKIFEDTELSLGIDAGYTNNTYQDRALNTKSEYIEYTNDGVSYKINNNAQSLREQKDYVCRTEAQKICHAEGQDDVRTAVDGFPMVCFYRTSHAANDLVFMGQYNFINDKGSYEVFGFEDIEDPNDKETMIYDASKVECWEGLKNANPISLFQTTENWMDPDKGWASTFESRYPDPDDYGVAGKKWYDASEGSPLHELCKWIVSTRHEKDTVYGEDKISIDAYFAKKINSYQYGYSETTKDSYQYAEGAELEDNAENRQKKFETEKWEHFDVWKLAGYYIFLMRYGAVDQFVKNTMLFTDGNGKYDIREDNKYRKWFYINYDNDCLFGLRNNGELAFDWKLNRQTLDGSTEIKDDGSGEANVNTYAMMGHDSTLWNNLEADAEFMRMVRDLDNSMNAAGLNYKNMVKEFDTDQTEQWCERIYNANERYKYIQAAKGIGDMEGKPVDNLWMLQGTRRSHRHWWIANHFDLLDAQWLSGNYKNTYVEIKTDCMTGDKISAVAGMDYYYAWGQQKMIYESNMVRKEGEPIDFIFSTNQVQGDPVYIYAVNKMSELDFSKIAYKVAAGSFGFHIGNSDVQNTLKKLVIGNPNVINKVTGITTTTWATLSNLEYLDITNYQGIKSVPLTSFPNLHVLKAAGTSIGSFVPAEGATLERVELPTTVSTLIMKDLKFKSFENDFGYVPNTSLVSLTLSNNDGIGMTYFNNLIKPWIESIEKTARPSELYSEATIDISNIQWNFANLDDIRLFKNFKKYAKAGRFNLRGEINLISCGNLSKENLAEIREIFGDNCFNKLYASLYVITPDSIYIETDKNEIVAGKSQVYRRELYPDEESLEAKDASVEYYLVRPATDGDDANKIFDDIITGKKFVAEDGSYFRKGMKITQSKDGNGRDIATVSTEENVIGSATDVTVLVSLTTNTSDTKKLSFIGLRVLDPTYVASAEITGTASLYRNKTYMFQLNPKTKNGQKPIGTYDVTWTIEGDGKTYVEGFEKVENNTFKIIMKETEQPEISSIMNITANITNYDGTSAVTSFRALVLNEAVIMSVESNPVAMKICHETGWAINENAMTKAEAEAIKDLGTAFSGVKDSFSFEEFRYFTGVEALADNAFAESVGLTSIVLPSSIKSMGTGVFKNCTGLMEVKSLSSDIDSAQIYSLPSGIKTIPENTFLNCRQLRKLIVHEGITGIGAFAFGGTSIRKVLLTTDELEDWSIIFPESLENISGNAFETKEWTIETTDNCLEILSISKRMRLSDNIQLLLGKKYREFRNANSSYSVLDGILYDAQRETLLRFPAMRDAVIEEYRTENVQAMRQYAFFAVKNINSVILPSSVAANGLGIHLFDGGDIQRADFTACTNLAKLPDYIFANCANLSEINFPEKASLSTLGVHLFDNCIALRQISLPSTITTVSTEYQGYPVNGNACMLFVNCGIEELVIPEKLTKTGKCIAVNCSNLKTVRFSKLFNELSTSYLIRDCDSITDIYLPVFSYTKKTYGMQENGIVIGTYETREEAEAVCGQNQQIVESSNSIVVNETMNRDISNSAFDAPSNLQNFHLHEEDDHVMIQEEDGVLYEDNFKKLFAMPYGRETIAFNKNMTIVGSGALNSLSKATEISFPEYIETMEMSSCWSIENLTTLRFMKGCGTFDKSVFYNERNLKEFVILSDKAPQIEVFDGGGNFGGSFLHNGHPFGSPMSVSAGTINVLGNNFFGYNNRDSKSNICYIPYGASGYDTELWQIPLTLVELCGFTFKPYPLNGNGVIKVYSNGELYSGETVYMKSESGDFTFSNGATMSATYSDGGYSFDFGGKVYHHERIFIYSDSGCTNPLGDFKAEYGTTIYEVNKPASIQTENAQTHKAKSIFAVNNDLYSEEQDEAQQKVKAEAELANETAMANITQNEYEALVSRINQLSDIVGRLKKEK